MDMLVLNANTLIILGHRLAIILIQQLFKFHQ